MKAKFSSSVAGAVFSLVLISMLSKSIGFVREIIFAGKFGLSNEFDLFLVSSIIPLTINSAVIYLAQHYFVPAFNKIDESNEQLREAFLNNSFHFFFWGSLIIALILFLFSSQILNTYFGNQPQNTKDLARVIFLLLIITIPLNAGIAVFSAYMQSNFRFILPALIQVLINILIIIIILFYHDFLKIVVLPISFLISYIAAFLVMILILRNKLKLKVKVDFLKEMPNVDFIIYLVFIEILSLSYSLIDRYFYGQINPGGIAALSYAINIYAIPISFFSLAIISAIFSKFSKTAVYDESELLVDFKKSIELNVYLMIPLTIMMIFMGEFFIQIFYERGKFVSSDTAMTFNALRCYALSLVFYSTYLIIVKLLYSLSLYRVIFIGSIIAFVLKIVLNFTLVNNYQQNGLAISTSIVYLFLFTFSFILSTEHLKMKDKIFFVKQLVFNLLNALFSYSIIYLIISFIHPQFKFYMLLKIILFTLTFVLNSIFCNDNSFKVLLNTLQRLFSRQNTKTMYHTNT